MEFVHCTGILVWSMAGALMEIPVCNESDPVTNISAFFWKKGGGGL